MQQILQNSQQYFFTSFDTTKIYYEKAPGDASKPTLIFLHGFGGDGSAWDIPRSYFQKLGFPTLTPDLRGHGFSERPTEASSYSLDSFAKDIQSLIQKEKIKEYILLGHCLGGAISLVATATNRIKPKGLILIATGFKAPEWGKGFSSSKIVRKILFFLSNIPLTIRISSKPDYTLSTYVGTEDIDMRRVILDILHTSPQSYFSIMSYLVEFDGLSLLERINVPTFIISGERDIFFPPFIARELHSHIKISRLDILKGANHILVLNNPEELSKTIEKNLRGLLSF